MLLFTNLDWCFCWLQNIHSSNCPTKPSAFDINLFSSAYKMKRRFTLLITREKRWREVKIWRMWPKIKREGGGWNLMWDWNEEIRIHNCWNPSTTYRDTLCWEQLKPTRKIGNCRVLKRRCYPKTMSVFLFLAVPTLQVGVGSLVLCRRWLNVRSLLCFHLSQQLPHLMQSWSQAMWRWFSLVEVLENRWWRQPIHLSPRAPSDQGIMRQRDHQNPFQVVWGQTWGCHSHRTHLRCGI